MLASVGGTAFANNADRFLEHDPIGWMMAIISMAVVFSALLVLFISFKYGYVGWSKFWHKVMIDRYRAHKAKKLAKETGITVTDKATGEIVDNGEIVAAIGMALFLNEDGMHDSESDVLTLSSTQSGWTGVGYFTHL